MPAKENAPAESESTPPDLPVVNMPEYITVDMFNELQLELHQLRAEFVRLRNQIEAVDEPGDDNS